MALTQITPELPFLASIRVLTPIPFWTGGIWILPATISIPLVSR